MKLSEVTDNSRLKKAILTLQQLLIDKDIEAEVVHNMYGLSLKVKLDDIDVRVRFKPFVQYAPGASGYTAWVEGYETPYLVKGLAWDSWDDRENFENLAKGIDKKLQRAKAKKEIGALHATTRKYTLYREADKRFGHIKCPSFARATVDKRGNNVIIVARALIRVADRKTNPANGDFGYLVSKYTLDAPTFTFYKTLPEALDAAEEIVKTAGIKV
jgi:hypothetical protein